MTPLYVRLIPLYVYLTIIACLVIGSGVYYAGKHEPITKDEFYVRVDDGGDAYMTSLPETTRAESKFKEYTRLGFITVYTRARENGVWDKEPMIMGPWWWNPRWTAGFNTRMEGIERVLDKAIPDEAMVSFGYYPDYNQATIYLGPERWDDGGLNELYAQRLNKERKKLIWQWPGIRAGLKKLVRSE